MEGCRDTGGNMGRQRFPDQIPASRLPSALLLHASSVCCQSGSVDGHWEMTHQPPAGSDSAPASDRECPLIPLSRLSPSSALHGIKEMLTYVAWLPKDWHPRTAGVYTHSATGVHSQGHTPALRHSPATSYTHGHAESQLHTYPHIDAHMTRATGTPLQVHTSVLHTTVTMSAHIHLVNSPVR